MQRFILGCGLLCRGRGLLLVRCTYPSEPEPLWVLPGGGQEPGEALSQTVQREFLDETSLRVQVERIAYLSESVDAARDQHVLNCTFWVREKDPEAVPRPADPKVVEARFIPFEDVPGLLEADVLRIPVAAALAQSGLGGNAEPPYYAFDAHDVEVPFFGRRSRVSPSDGASPKAPRHG